MVEQEGQQAASELEQERPGRSLWGDAVLRLRKDRFAVVSFSIIVAYFFVAILSGVGLIAREYDKVNYKVDISKALAVLEEILKESKTGPDLRKTLEEVVAQEVIRDREAFIRSLHGVRLQARQAHFKDIEESLSKLEQDTKISDGYAPPSWKQLVLALSGAGLVARDYNEIYNKSDVSGTIRALEKIVRRLDTEHQLRRTLEEVIVMQNIREKELFLRCLDGLRLYAKQAGHEGIVEPLSQLGQDMKDSDYYAAPSWRYLLGTDVHGRDVFRRVIQGSWISLRVALIMSVIYIVIAVLLGALAGFFGGWVDDLILWLYQTTASVPGILLLIALTFVLGKGLGNVAIALGLVGWVGLCRLMRAEFIKHRARDYVLAARAQGAGSWRIMFRHILPNTSHIVIISFSLGFVRAIMGEVVLTFVGLGAQAHEPSWGRMISEARAELARDPTVWWPLAGATVAMFIVCLAFNIFGDSLRDALDPKLKV